MRLIERPHARTVFLVLTLFTLLAGDSWRYSIGWLGFGILAGLIVAASVALLVVQRNRWRFGALPYPLLAFLAVAALSIAWSFYPGASALGVTVTIATVVGALAVAVTYRWDEILRGLGIALRAILGLSLVFELVVAAVIRHPVLPPVPEPGIDYATLDRVPLMLYWSRNELFSVFDGGKIQGIVGNSALLSFVAVVGIIVFAIQLIESRRVGTVVWIAIAAACLVFSRSATTIVTVVVLAAVVLAVLLVRRFSSPRARVATYASILVVAGAIAVTAVSLQSQLLTLLGKSPDLTGRLGIWDAVVALAEQRPVAGWGWVGYWVPWVPPFDTLVFRNGVRQLHAHNAWLDIWLQLGIIGLVVFGALVLSTFSRAWSLAVDRPQLAPRIPGAYRSLALLPLLVLVALLVQSLAESRLLVEYGLFLLALVSITTKAGDTADPLR